MSENNPRAGSTLESLLREDGFYEEAKNHAVKSVLACKLARAMEAQNLSKTRMAARMERGLYIWVGEHFLELVVVRVVLRRADVPDRLAGESFVFRENEALGACLWPALGWRIGLANPDI